MTESSIIRLYINHSFGGYAMYLVSLTKAASIAGELTLVERWIASAKVILTGFVVVFSMLLLLIGIIKLYSFIVMEVQDKTSVQKQKKDKVTQPKDSLNKSQVKPVPVLSDPSTAEDGLSEEIVAVIAAAVASTYGGKGRVKIKSIKKSGGRSAWANAGVLENTRPF